MKYLVMFLAVLFLFPRGVRAGEGYASSASVPGVMLAAVAASEDAGKLAGEYSRLLRVEREEYLSVGPDGKPAFKPGIDECALKKLKLEQVRVVEAYAGALSAVEAAIASASVSSRDGLLSLEDELSTEIELKRVEAAALKLEMENARRNAADLEARYAAAQRSLQRKVAMSAKMNKVKAQMAAAEMRVRLLTLKLKRQRITANLAASRGEIESALLCREEEAPESPVMRKVRELLRWISGEGAVLGAQPEPLVLASETAVARAPQPPER